MLSLQEQILDKAKNLKVIPTLNAIIDKVFSILGDKNSSFADLHDAVQYDQAISSKIISIANSAFYGRGVPIFSLQRAMTTIGFDEVKNIVMCLLFLVNILKELKLKPEVLMDLWKHSLFVACASKALATRMVSEDPHKVFTLALLHDIGKIVFYLSMEDYRQVMEEAVRRGKPLSQIEKAAFGVDHQEVGHILSIKWKFPEEFSYVTRYHHEHAQPGKYELLLKIISAADRFSVERNHASDPESFILLKERDQITKEVRRIMAFFNVA